MNTTHFTADRKKQFASDKYQSLFNVQRENDRIANFTKVLEHFRLKIGIRHDIGELRLEIAEDSYKI